MSGELWQRAGWYVDPITAGNVLTTVAAVGAYSERASFAWRGLRSIDYGCVSSLQRSISKEPTESDLRTREVAMLAEARRWGLGYRLGNWTSDLQLLADLQHYGAATRLVDVTSNPMTALWFACQEVSEPGVSHSGVLVAINTLDWPRYGKGQPASTRDAIGNPAGWELTHALRQDQPFVVEPLDSNERLRAQSGYFVASSLPNRVGPASPFGGLSVKYHEIPPGRASKLLNDRLTDSHRGTSVPIPFLAIKIRARLKARILRILENSYDRSARVLFPDFDGFNKFAAFAQRDEFVSRGT